MHIRPTGGGLQAQQRVVDGLAPGQVGDGAGHHHSNADLLNPGHIGLGGNVFNGRFFSCFFYSCFYGRIRFGFRGIGRERVLRRRSRAASSAATVATAGQHQAENQQQTK
jgi:hypothetical protein